MCDFYLSPQIVGPCYIEMFTNLDTCESHGFTLYISYLHLDFDVPKLYEAASHLWPDVALKACHFNLSEAWWRKFQALELSAACKNVDSNIGK